jgi:hypothetical protein
VTIYFGWNDHWLSYGLPDKELISASTLPAVSRLATCARIPDFFLFLQPPIAKPNAA